MKSFEDAECILIKSIESARTALVLVRCKNQPNEGAILLAIIKLSRLSGCSFITKTEMKPWYRHQDEDCKHLNKKSPRPSKSFGNGIAANSGAQDKTT